MKSQQLGLNDPLKYNNAKRTAYFKSSSLFRQTWSDILCYLLSEIFRTGFWSNELEGNKRESHIYIHPSSVFYSSQLLFATLAGYYSYPQEPPLSSKCFFGEQVLSHKSLDTILSPCFFTSNVWTMLFKTQYSAILCIPIRAQGRGWQKAVLCTFVQREVCKAIFSS